VYYGANNIAEHVPKNSIINAAEVGTKVATAELVKKMMNNRTLWESYHEWRKDGVFPPDLAHKYGFLKTVPYCRMCKWAHAKTHGLGWNHTTQTIQEPALPRTLCIAENGLLQAPFVESWLESTDESMHPIQKADSCTNPGNTPTNSESPQVLQLGDFRVERTVVAHDGVVDMVISDAHSHGSKELILQVEIPIRNWEGAHFRDVHRQIATSNHVGLMSSIVIQDASSRVTLLTNWQTAISCPSTNGTIHVSILGSMEENLLGDETRRIRFLVEDVDPVRDVSSEYAMSPYAHNFIQDFLDPLALFYVDS